jgi:hypothetical protein
VETGSREENASKQKLQPGSDPIRTGLQPMRRRFKNGEIRQKLRRAQP